MKFLQKAIVVGPDCKHILHIPDPHSRFARESEYSLFLEILHEWFETLGERVEPIAAPSTIW